MSVVSPATTAIRALDASGALSTHAWSLGNDQHAMSRGFGDRVERICREYIELRWLPPTSTRSLGSSYNWCTVLRPLLYHFPKIPTPIHSTTRYCSASLMAADLSTWNRASRVPTPRHLVRLVERRSCRNISCHAPLERMPLCPGAIIPGTSDAVRR